MCLGFSQYSYSDTETVYGASDNAAANGLNWVMQNVLPDYSSPNISLQINGLTYYYIMTKDESDDVKVFVRNTDLANGGYVFEEVDDWSGVPGNSIQRYFRFNDINAERWGPGEISIQGDGTVSDPSVIYLYKMDIEPSEIICTNPIEDPDCPAFSVQSDKYNDPYYDEWVQESLNRETAEQETIETEDEETDDLEKRLGIDPSVGGLIDPLAQSAILLDLSRVYILDTYYSADIDGKEYNDSIQLQDSNISDNNRALRHLASDAKHYSMVRSQYDENNNGE